MSAAGSAVRSREKVRTKPYVMKRDRKTGALYLERERPPFIGELPYAAALVLTIFIAVLSCFQYIRLRTEVETRISRAAALEREIVALKDSNMMMECAVYQTPDLNQVYEIAVTELGMIPATEEHIREFERSDSGYVYQTDNIPKIGF
ncbi:MAG: hypothetical protein Q4C73_03525 [Eubacteriales bacterium]|nr:hypothetical protein [Eubacteriales bacterium]